MPHQFIRAADASDDRVISREKLALLQGQIHIQSSGCEALGLSEEVKLLPLGLDLVYPMGICPLRAGGKTHKKEAAAIRMPEFFLLDLFIKRLDFVIGRIDILELIKIKIDDLGLGLLRPGLPFAFDRKRIYRGFCADTIQKLLIAIDIAAVAYDILFKLGAIFQSLFIFLPVKQTICNKVRNLSYSLGRIRFDLIVQLLGADMDTALEHSFVIYRHSNQLFKVILV